MEKHRVESNEDILCTLDRLLSNEETRWNKFFTNISESHPLATTLPDENLVSFISKHSLKGQRALDIGCGNGRNSVFLAKNGYKVEALDISQVALERAQALAKNEKVNIDFINQSFLNFNFKKEKYDLIYDLGCLHHIHPHRRPKYLESIKTSLKTNGVLLLGTFNEKMGFTEGDLQVYKSGTMAGGLSFTPDDLNNLFLNSLECLELREMKPLNCAERGVGWNHMTISTWKKLK